MANRWIVAIRQTFAVRQPPLARSVQVVSHFRTSEHDDPREARRVKDVLPFMWLCCGHSQSFFEYDPDKTLGRQEKRAIQNQA